MPFKLHLIPEFIIEARRKADDLGKLNNSATQGRGNLSGYVGEICLAHHLGASHMSCEDGVENYSYDLQKWPLDIEVKTKRRTVAPKLTYEASIAGTSLHQTPDVYAFISIEFGRAEGRHPNKKYFDLRAVWLCGYYEASLYKKHSTFIRKGEVTGTNKFPARIDMHNMEYRYLFNELGE